MGWPFGVASRNWCRYRLGPIGVATHFLVSRHCLACLGSRPKFGVTTWPGHGRGLGFVTWPLVS